MTTTEKQDSTYDFSSDSLEDLERDLIVGCWESAKDCSWLSPLRPDDFGYERPRAGFEALQTALRQSSEVSLLVIRDIMANQGHQEHYEWLMTRCMQGAIFLSNSEIQAMVAHIRDQGSRRKMDRTLQACLRLVSDQRTPLAKIQEEIAKRVTAATSRATTGGPIQERDGFLALGAAMTEERLQAETDPEKAAKAYTTPWKSLTDLQKPKRGDYIVIAGLASQGKSLMMLQFARHLALDGPGCIFSKEMLAHHVLCRATAQDLKMNPNDVTGGHCYQMADIHARNVWIDTESCKWPRLLQKIREFVMRNPAAAWVAIDHFLLYAQGYEEATEASIALSGLLLELNVIGIVLMQMLESKFSVPGRKDKRPTINDLRETPQVKDDAARVWAIHRPHKWDNKADPRLVDILILKDRIDGNDGKSVRMTFDKSCVSFLDGAPPVIRTGVKTKNEPELREGYELTDDDYEEYGLPRSFGAVPMEDLDIPG